MAFSWRDGMTKKEFQTGGKRLLKAALAAAFVWSFFFGGLVSAAEALLVTVDLGWGYNSGGAPLSDYNLQVGSVVQIIMYDSTSGAQPPGPTAGGNFQVFDSYTGDGIAAHPYAGSEPSHVPSDTTTYLPHSMPDGHVLVHQATVQVAPYLDDNGDVWYQVFAQFEVLGNYDRLYVRVFGATDLYQQGIWASYWGISDVQVGTNNVGTWYIGPLDEIVADQNNYFFVIPEPGTMALLMLGGGVLAGARRRKKSVSKSV